MNRLLKISLQLLVTAFAPSIITNAQTCPGWAGCPDPTFGVEGIARIANVGGSTPVSTVLQSDGKILVMPRGLTSETGHKITRLNADGSLDTAFGSGSSASFVWKLTKGTSVYYGNANAIAIQTVSGSERLLVVGQSPILSGNKVITSRLRVDRLLPNGSLDTTWGSGGTLSINVSSASAVAVQPDQKIVVTSASFGELIRLNANGTLDPTFGSGGIVSSGNGWDLALDGVGRILVLGMTTTGRGNQVSTYYSVRRFFADGASDLSFGTNGVAVTSFPNRYRSGTVRIDPFGNVIVGTSTGATDATTDFAVYRFNTNGAKDTSFSGDGAALIDFGGGRDIGYSAIAQWDGKIVVVGSTAIAGSGSGSDFTLARVDYDGNIDTSFGIGGRIIGAHNPNGETLSTVLTLMDPACSCEKILATGRSSNNDLLAARFLE